ncbi:NAD-P-binding protein [Calocera viscosa TUFC12733]|uniref:NAD-P-binding protein n=1 Tax=Calocera viscosa (strain TUFC12733) TaxID=1330018 RepID=A0A167P5N9_CALVF|nr:NAD-P-binding protein [Calocera viscosa TUFC12733]
MSGYKTFAVAGAGAIGSIIVDELLKEKAAGKVDKVVVLTRSAAGNDALLAQGAEPIVVDYDSPPSLQSALHGIDVVISTVITTALNVQEPLGDAAKAAGVKLFVPSEFGGDTRQHTEGPYALKAIQRRRLGQIGLPWAAFVTGPFADAIFYVPHLGFDIANGKIEVGGTGDSLASFTSRRDIARYVVHVLTSLPASKLHNHEFRVEGERTTVNRVLAGYEARTGKKLDITHIPLDALKERGKGLPFNIQYFIASILELGGTNGPEDEMNVEWPDFKPQTVVEAILSYKP